MKLSQLKPCALCHGPLLKAPCGQWYVIRVSPAMLNPQHARETLAMNMYFNGALGIAEAMAPAADKAVTILGDDQRELMTEIHLCFDCYTRSTGELFAAIEVAKDTAEPELEGASRQ